MRFVLTIGFLLISASSHAADGWVPAGSVSLADVEFDTQQEPPPLPPLPNLNSQPLEDGKPAVQTDVPQSDPIVPEQSDAKSDSDSSDLAPPAPVIVEDEIDIRPPSTKDLEEALEEAEQPTWLNSVIDDHSLLWREVRSDGISILPASDFGLTSIGFDFGLSDGEGPVWTQLKFDWTFVNGPGKPDVRPQLYDISYEINYSDQFGNVGIHAQLAPTYSTDWDNKGKHAFRLIGGGLATLELLPGFDLVGGAMYLDRPDLEVLPIYGLRIHGEDHELDIVYPRFRYAVRVGHGDEGSDWLYAKSEFGGGAWAIDSDGFGRDQMGYRDWRLMFGWESRELDGDRRIFEAGLVFDRELEFERRKTTLNLGNTALIRMGRTF